MRAVASQPVPSADGVALAPPAPVPVAVPERDLPVPAVVRRNTLLLATSQAIVGAGTQMIPALGAIMVQQLDGPVALAGLASSLLGVSRFLVAYPVGRLTDRRGRVAGILTGQAVSLLGALLLGACLVLRSFPLFVLGLLVFGLGVGAGQQLRLGRRATMLAGTGLCALGAVLVPTSPDYWVATLGIFLVGLGWSAVTVSATAQIADVVAPQARGRAVGAGDALAGVASIACPLLAGVAVGAYGLGVLAPVVFLLLTPAALLLARPGRRRAAGLR